jgi:hypothetical protein
VRRSRALRSSAIDVPRGGVWLLQPGIYDVDSGGPDQPMRITVFEGSARFAGGGSDTLSTAVEHATQDEFLRWCRSHDYDQKRLSRRR